MMKLVSRRDFLKISAMGAVGAAAGVVVGTSASSQTATKIYTPGTYTATAEGLMSTVRVTMTFDETSIVDVIVDSSGETPEIGAAAAEKLSLQLKNAQGAEIDGVSGATVTGNAVKKAAADCVAQAMGLATDKNEDASTA